jgi:hypothetical protein
LNGWKDNLRQEIIKGGGESPCPFCSLPRVRRSDYVRCARCGINWLEGEALGSNPQVERRRKLAAQQAATTIRKDKADSGRE